MAEVTWLDQHTKLDRLLQITFKPIADESSARSLSQLNHSPNCQRLELDSTECLVTFAPKTCTRPPKDLARKSSVLLKSLVVSQPSLPRVLLRPSDYATRFFAIWLNSADPRQGLASSHHLRPRNGTCASIAPQSVPCIGV
jgi:hypothetical protein